jgi:hypothetical protein
MLTHLDFQTFQADMLTKKGMNIATRISDDDDAPNKVERFIDRVLLLVETEVKTYNKRFDYQLVSQAQKDAFYEACLEQALYLYILGDMSLISGYDPINNSVISIDEIRKRAMSPISKQILLNAGLLYRGLNNTYDGQRVPGYRQYW